MVSMCLFTATLMFLNAYCGQFKPSLHLKNHIAELYFLCMLPVGPLSVFGICYVLPVSWMASCFPIVDPVAVWRYRSTDAWYRFRSDDGRHKD